MAFRKNSDQQLSVYDSFNQLTPRVQKLIINSWANDFATIVFPAINEERFSVLYSSDPASRPNTPVNFIIGALMLKEYNQLTDDELMNSILCDVRYQYALHTTSCDEQPISDRTLSRFRERLYEYERSTGIDLLKEEMEALAEIYADTMNLRRNVKRMDSLMIASRCRAMSRLEIIYTCVSNMIHLLHRLGVDEYIPSEMTHYLDDEDRNKVIYHAKGEECSTRLEQVIRDAAALRDALTCDNWLDFSEYQLLIRVLQEQTRLDEDGKVTAKDKTEITSDSLQNPSDPDATYRKKAGKSHKGYVGNIVETIDEGKSIVSSFQYEPNNHSDSEFMSDYLENQPKHNSDEPQTIIADGAYASYDNHKQAKEKNTNLIPTALSGKETDEIFGKFELSDDETEVRKCPMGYAPVKQTLYEKTGVIRAQFRKCCCENCPHHGQCKGKPQRKTYAVHLTAKMVYRAQQMQKMYDDDYKQLSRKRNAVEGVMSVLRRRYRVDEIPVAGYIRSKMFFTVKVGAYNLGKLFRYCQGSRGSCALNQAFA